MKAKFRSLITRILLAIFLIYVAYSFVSTQIQINEKKEELNKITAMITAQKSKVDELHQLLENGIDDSYIEKYARDNADMAKPGEHVYKRQKMS